MFRKNYKLFAMRFGMILIMLGGVLCVSPVKSVLASTITVTNTNDSGAGSLRQAIASAVSGDTIKFSPSLSGQTITLSSQLDITKNLVVDGSGLDPRISISGNNIVRIFNISNRVFALRSLILKNGKMSGVNYTAFGGALFVNSSTTLTLKTYL